MVALVPLKATDTCTDTVLIFLNTKYIFLSITFFLSPHRLIWGRPVPRTTLWCYWRWRQRSGRTSPSWWRSRSRWRSRLPWAWTDLWHLYDHGSPWARWPAPPRLLPQGHRSGCALRRAARGRRTRTGCSPRWGDPRGTCADIWLVGERHRNVNTH